MKVSRIQEAENHERILDVATRLFRERGIDGIGVADLMKAAGLTHGAFYGHFKSKEDLVAQACARAVLRMKQNWTNVIDQATGNPLEALAATYLTPKHRDGAGRGCPMAALGSEIARQAPPVRRAFTDELSPFLDYLSRNVEGNSKSLRRQKALATYAGLVGALIVSRAVDDLELSNEILSAVAATMRRNEVERTPLKTPGRSRTTVSKRHSSKTSSRSRKS
ncbi:MAG TPA: TetR/AcrR family transcriptional regulator [Edaphobacter sp.]|nr:TetR/AcrR family transcriptional regulator [Edaphobacter sp.]